MRNMAIFGHRKSHNHLYITLFNVPHVYFLRSRSYVHGAIFNDLQLDIGFETEHISKHSRLGMVHIVAGQRLHTIPERGGEFGVLSCSPSGHRGTKLVSTTRSCI